MQSKRTSVGSSNYLKSQRNILATLPRCITLNCNQNCITTNIYAGILTSASILQPNE